MAADEPELLILQRAFPEAQRLLMAPPTRRIGIIETGWHDVDVSPHAGAAAVVRLGGPLDDLVGEVLLASSEGASILVYVTGRADIETDLSLARRAFHALAPLGLGRISPLIEVTG